MESVFDVEFVPLTSENGSGRVYAKEVDFKMVSLHTERKPKKIQGRLPWWAGLTEEEKMEFREKKKRDMIRGLERLTIAMEHGINVCVDLSWDAENSAKEKRSLWKQLSLSYAFLKRTEVPVHLHITSFVEESETGSGLGLQGVQNWQASRHIEAPWDLFPSESIIILSPDAEDVLEDVDPKHVYVIGGIVDKTVRKGRTRDIAAELGIIARRLPIQEFVPHRLTHVLNIDTVISILCSYLQTRDWHTSITGHMPARRQKPTSAIVAEAFDCNMQTAAGLFAEEDPPTAVVPLEPELC